MATNPYIYVSSLYGTNTGGTDTSKAAIQTGNINLMAAGDVYDSIEAAIIGTGTTTDGDELRVCDDSSAGIAWTTNRTLNTNGSYTGVGVKVISVDHLNVENYKPGAAEDNASTNDLYLKYNGIIAGVDIKGADEALVSTTVGTNWVFQDMVVTNGGGFGDNCLRFGVDAISFTLTNVELASTGASAEFFFLTSGGRVIWNGGKVSGTMPGALFGLIGGAGGATAILTEVDLSALNKPFFPNLVAGTSDVVLLRLQSCQLHASVVLPTPSNMGSGQQRFEMFNCDDTTANKYHRFLIVDGTGLAKNNDSVYVTANLAWGEGTDKSSIKVETDPMISHANPFIFTIPDQYVDLSSTSTDKVTVNLVTDATLTDTDIAAFLVYPDKATAVIPRQLTSGKTVGAGNYGVDPIAAGTTLPTSALGAADWTGEPASPNFYKMDLDTASVPGGAGAAMVRIEVYKDFTTAGNVLYIDVLLEIGT